MTYTAMSGKNDKKKTKDEFTSFLLDDELSSQKTAVLHKPKVADEIPQPPPLPVNSETAKIIADDKTLPVQNIPLKNPETSVAERKESVSVMTRKPILESVKNQFEKQDKTVSRVNNAMFSKDGMDPALFSLEAALKQSEYLRLAQNKVNELEKKLAEVIQENETLSASAIVLQKKYDQAMQQLDHTKQDNKAKIENYKDELVLKDKVSKIVNSEKEELLKKNDELQTLMNEKIQQIRVRERELENRLEILQHEGDVVITTKDESILDHKKQIDQLHFELENFKAQSRELNKNIQDQKDQMRRSIKALRLALNLLENEELNGNELKKTGT